MNYKVLQKYVLLEQNKELSLALDCKTRWSSMYEMIERFMSLKKCISKALLDLAVEHDISAAEILFLKELKCALEPIKLAVDALSPKDATLLTAERIFQFLFFELKKRKSNLAEDLLCSVKNRAQQRRQHDMVNLIRYLQNPNLSIHDKHYANDISLLGSSTKDGFVKMATTLFCRLFWENDSNKGRGQDENEEIGLANNTNKNQEHKSLLQRLQTLIKHSTNSTPTQFETFVDDRSLVSQLQTVI